MSLQIPSELTWLVQIVGGDAWPEGDEDKLRVLATAWEEASRELTAVQGEVDSVTAAVLSALQGTASEEFRKFTQAFKAQVPDVAVTAKQLGDLAKETALQVEYAKYMIVGTLIMLAVQIAWALANAFWTFGASTATIPAMQAAARISVQVVLKNLVMAVLFGIVFQVGMDAAIQGIQMLKGDRTKWDTDLTKGAAIAGAIGGVIGFGLGAAGKRFAPKFSHSIAGEMTKGGLHEWLTEQVSGVVQGNWNGLNPAAASAGAIEGAVDGIGGRKKKGGGTQAGKNKIANAHVEGIDKLDLSKMPPMTDSPVTETGGKPARDPGTRTTSAQPDSTPASRQSTSDSGGKVDTTTPPPAQAHPVTPPSTAPKQTEHPVSPKTEHPPSPRKTTPEPPKSTEPVKPSVPAEPGRPAQPKPTITQPETHQQATKAEQQPVRSQPSHQPAQSPVTTHTQTEPAPQPVRTQHPAPSQPAASTPPPVTTTAASTAQTPATSHPASLPQPATTTQPTTQPASPGTAHQNTPDPQGIPALDGPVKAGPQTLPHSSHLAASTPPSTVTPPPAPAEPKPSHPAPQPTPVPVPASAPSSLTPSTSDTPAPRSVPPMSRPAPPSPQETGHRYQPTVAAHPVPSSHTPPPVPAPPPPPPAPPLSPPTPRVTDRAPRPRPAVPGVETEWPRNRQPEWYQGLRDGVAKRLPDPAVPDPLTVHATHEGAHPVDVDLAPVRAGFHALFQDLRNKGIRVPEVRVSAERVVQVDKTTFAKHFTLDMVFDPDGSHPDPVLRAEILAPDFIRELARPDSAARRRLDQLAEQFEIADLLEISESNPARATSGQVLLNTGMLGTLTPVPAHQSAALRHLLAHEFMHLHAHDPGRAFAGHPDEGVYRHEINTDEAVTELLARMVTDALADRAGTKPEYLRFPETFAPAPGGLRYQPNVTAFDRALGRAPVIEVLGGYFGPAESTPPVARPVPPRPPVSLRTMAFASPDGRYLFEKIKKTPANERGDADTLWVRRGEVPPAFAVPTGRVGDRDGKRYVEYQTELFVNDCLHTAEEILNNQQYPYDLAPGQKQQTVPLRSQVAGTEHLFGNSFEDNRTVAQDYLAQHGANANEKAAPQVGQAFVMVPTKDAPHDDRDHAPYHAAAVVAVGEGYVITAERFADNVDAKDHDRGRGKFRVYPVGAGGNVPGYSIGRVNEPAKTFHEFTKVNFEGREPITIVVEAAPEPGPPAKRQATGPDRQVVPLRNDPALVVSAPELRSVTTVRRDGEHLVIEFGGKPPKTVPATVDIAGVTGIVIHGQGGGGSLALPVTTKQGESRRWVPPAVAAEVIDEVLHRNQVTGLPIELRVPSTEQASRYSLAQVLADRRQQNIAAGEVVFEAGKDGVPPSLDAQVKGQLDHQPRYGTRGRAAPVAVDPTGHAPATETADWAQPKNPLPPSKWESLRDKAPVRTVDYEARDILRSSDPKHLEFIPGLVRYDVRRMEVEPGHWVQEYTLKVHLKPEDGISPQAMADTRAKALAGVDSVLNKGYRLPSGDQFHVRVEFTETGAHTTVKLTGTENANQVEWGTATPQNVLAHEIAHYFGLPDEYRDSGPWQRIFNSDGKPLPGGRKPLNSVVEDDGLMGQQVYYAPTLLPRHLRRIEQTMTSQVHLPDGSHAVLTDPRSPAQTPLDLPKHGFRPPEEPPGPVPPARPNQKQQVLLDRMERGHTFSSGERDVLRRIVDGLPEEIVTDPVRADRIVAEIPAVAGELAGNLASLRETAARWQAQRVAPAELTGLIVAHADEIVHNALATAVRIAGAPAHSWAVVALGGYGRKELAPASDLDFAIVGDVEDDSPGHRRLQVLQNLTCDVINLARARLNASLPPGTGPVLFQADPMWLPTHKSARPEWLAEHTLVTAEPGLPNFGVGFDARMIPVDLPGADASVFGRFREPHERLPPGRAKQALGDLVPAAKSTMDIQGRFDVKETLLRPLTLGTRWLGASEGQLGRSNTADRLRTLGDLGVLKRDQVTELRTAFDTVQGLRQKLHAHYGRENDEARLPAPLSSRFSALFAGGPAKPDHGYVLTETEAKSVLAARDTIARYLDFLDGYRLNGHRQPAARPAPQQTGYALSERQHTELGRLGHREQSVPADGWCLFHALAATAGERLGGAGWEQIRLEVADRVEHATGAEADRYRLLLTPTEGQTAVTLAEAATVIRTDSDYYTTTAGDLAVQAVADRYGVRLSVVNEDGSVTSVGDGHEVVLVRTLNERKAAHFWATEALPEPVTETPREPVVEKPTEPVAETSPVPVVEKPTEPVTEPPTEPVTEAPRTATPGTPPVYLSRGLLGTGQVEQVLGHPVREPDAIAAALVDAVTDNLPLAVEKQARQAIVDLIERHGPAGATRRLLAGEQLVDGDTPVRARLRVTGTRAAPVGAEVPTAAATSTVSTTGTTTSTSTVSPLSAAVAVTSAVADGHFLTVKPTLKPVDERTRQQAVTHTAETTHTVTATGKTGFEVDAVLDISVGGRTHTTDLPSALRVRYPGEVSSVTADRQAVIAPDAVHRVFGVVEDAGGLTAIRDALLERPGVVPGSPLHRAITGGFSVDTPATHGRHLLGGVLTATDGTAGVAVRSTPTHFQRVETSDLTLEQSASSTRKDKTAQAGAFGTEVGVALSYGAPGVKIPSGEVKIAATASATAGPSRSLTTAATIEGAAKTTLKYDGETVLYRVDTEYAVEGTGLDYRGTHRGQVYVRVPSWQAAEFEAALRGETASAALKAAPLDPPAAPDAGTATALSAVDSATGLEHVTGKATELLDKFFAGRKTQLDTVKAQLAETLSAANLRDSYEQVREGLRVPISVAGRNLTLTVKAYLGKASTARRVGTVEIASSTGSTGSVESKDTKSSNRGVGLEVAARIGVDRDKPGLLAGITLGGAAKWQDADSSATSAATGSTHKLTYSGPGVAVDYPATFEVALSEGNRAEGQYVSGSVRMVLPESDCLPSTFTAIPAAKSTLSPTGAISLPPGSALPGRLDHVDKVNAAIAQALAVTRKGVGAWRGLTPLTVPTSVAHARFDRMLNGGLDLQVLAPGAVHRRTDAVRVELELRHPKLVGDGEGVTSETQHTSSVSTESGHSKSWGVEGYAQAGAGAAAGVRKGVGGEEGTTDSVGGKNTSTIKRSGAHLKYRADAVYWVTAYSWQDGPGAGGHPATHRIPVVLPDGVEYWMPKDRAEKANLPVAEPSMSTVDDKRWYLPEHIGKSLGNVAVDEVSPATRILPEARRLLNRYAPEFAPHSQDTGAPTGVIPALRAAFSPSDVKAALRRAATSGQSVVVHRSTWRGLRQLEIRVAARLDTANARSAGSERIAVDSTAEGSSAHATSKTTNSTIAATLDGMAPQVRADPASAVSGVPAGGLLAGRQTGGTDSTGHTVKNADKIKGGKQSVRFEVPVEYVVEIFRDGNRVDGTTLRDGTASLLVPEELCPTTEPAGTVASHSGAVDLRGAKVLAQAMPGGPELAAELRRLITESANEVAFFRAGDTTKLVAEGRHGGQKTAVFTDEDLRIGNFGRLLDGIEQTVVDNDLATTTGYRFGMRLEVVSPELLGTVELTTEQATKIANETGTAHQTTTTGTFSLGGTAQGTTGPGTTGGTPGTAATTKKSTAAQTTGTGNREETVTHGGTYYRYRATARYDLSVVREQGNVLDRRFGTGTRHRTVTMPDGVYLLVPRAEAERLKLPLPGQPPAARPAPPEAPVDREPPRETEDLARPWHALSTVDALKLAVHASSATHEEEDEDDVRITPPPSITRPKGGA
ncbi:putative nucleotidyltransferase substrate binding domain-containing protein [Amycolatopsis sp. NPDC059027]|uniref:WXG100-like domain-containing protein n=1 Tax=Amycolatopsis sp. NPDC059027 TaxID=3346709 RepID=UPI0036729981